MRLVVASLGLALVTLSPASPATADNACVTAGWTDPVTGTHSPVGKCVPTQWERTCQRVDQSIALDIGIVGVHVCVCVPSLVTQR